MQKIILAHNRYRQEGGEDILFASERHLLLQNGHEVFEFARSNATIRRASFPGVALGAIWSLDTYEKLRKLIRHVGPEVAHFHNTFLLISPSAYYACRHEGIPVVQTLHNYRLLCPGAQLRRSQEICEDCVGKAAPWPSILHGCWRESRAQTSVVAAMLACHRALGTWNQLVDVYIALTQFARQKFIEGGLPADRIAVKPNFIYPDPGPREGRGDYALFVGRLSLEKGLHTLTKAWQSLNHIPLKVVGDGPLMRRLSSRVNDEGLDDIDLLGRLDHSQTLELLKGARFLVFPSIWYEGFPMVIGEAFACGVPVIASRLGGMLEIVEDQVTGLHFAPGNAADLAGKVKRLWSDPAAARRMGAAARIEYERKYTAERNYALLMKIYDQALASTR